METILELIFTILIGIIGDSIGESTKHTTIQKRNMTWQREVLRWKTEWLKA